MTYNPLSFQQRPTLDFSTRSRSVSLTSQASDLSDSCFIPDAFISGQVGSSAEDIDDIQHLLHDPWSSVTPSIPAKQVSSASSSLSPPPESPPPAESHNDIKFQESLPLHSDHDTCILSTDIGAGVDMSSPESLIEHQPSCKVFVGGCSFATSEDDITQFFEQLAGPVASAQIVRAWESGKSRGFAFVTFHSPAHALSVVDRSFMLMGRRVEVKQANPHSNFSGGEGSRRVFVSNLPPDTQPGHLWQLAANYGTPSHVKICTEPVSGKPRGFGFLTFRFHWQAQAFVNHRPGHWLIGRRLSASLARPKPSQ